MGDLHIAIYIAKP